MLVHYDSNNSGGSWWLSENDWHNLESAGWKVEWREANWLNCLASKASKNFDSLEDGIAEWESIVRQDATEEGCECCGQPHNFW